MRAIVACMASIMCFCSCRRDPGEDDLKWSCATVQRSGQAIATPECVEELQKTKSPVLKYYQAIAQTAANGKIKQYFLIEKDVQAESQAVSAKIPTTPASDIKLEAGETAFRSKNAMREKRN